MTDFHSLYNEWLLLLLQLKLETLHKLNGEFPTPGALTRLSEAKVAQSCLTLWLYSLWNSPGQNTGVSSLSLLQGTVPTQGLNLFPALWADSLPAEPQGTEIQGKFSQVFLGLFIWVLFSLVWGKVNCVSIKGLLPHLGKLFRSLWTCPMWSPWWCSHLIFWTSPSVLDFWKILLWNRLLV